MNLSQHSECDESRLLVLLEGEEHSDAYQLSATHVHQCSDCQQRLASLVADENTWTTVSESLSDSEAVREDPQAQLAALSPPNHPEMLGRLGRYEVASMIGSGGMGVVFKGHDTELNRPVAIKLLAHHLAHHGAARQRFAREARAAAAIVHEHVVAIHDIESEADTPFMVMHYVPGESLQTRVDETGPLGVKEILRIGSQAAAALAAAHEQGVIHRDVKPSNILLEHGVERTLLTDFGLARVTDDATVTRTGMLAGTPNYMSPEQANGDVVDHRSDLFSLGAVLYFMATGRPPFRAERAMAVLKRICHDPHRPVWKVNPEMPDELSEMIDLLLEKKPQRRIATAEQVRQVLSALLAKLQEKGSLRRRPSYRRWSTNQRRWFACGALCLLVVGGGLLSWSSLFSTLPSEEQPTASFPADNDELSVDRRAANDLEELMKADVSPRAELDTGFTAVNGSVQQLEWQSNADRLIFLQGTDDPWNRELGAIERKLIELENQFVPSPTAGEK